jgi:hypothetical protein
MSGAPQSQVMGRLRRRAVEMLDLADLRPEQRSHYIHQAALWQKLILLMELHGPAAAPSLSGGPRGDALGG